MYVLSTNIENIKNFPIIIIIIIIFFFFFFFFFFFVQFLQLKTISVYCGRVFVIQSNHEKCFTRTDDEEQDD